MKIAHAAVVCALMSCSVAVADYDSIEWLPLRSLSLQPPGSKINAVLHMGEYLYVGGDFTNIAGVNAKGIARWNGTWQPMGGGIEGLCYEFYGGGKRSFRCIGTVYALAPDYQGGLYVGGSFNYAGNVTAANIAKWNGTSWSALTGQGFQTRVYELWDYQTVRALLSVQDGTLYVGGELFQAGGSVNVTNIASYSSGVWRACGAGLNDDVLGLGLMTNGRIVAVGDFTMSGAQAVSHIATWKGETDWQALPGGGLDGPGYTILSDRISHLADADGNLYVGGAFVTAGTTAVNRVGCYSNGTWRAMGGGMSLGAVRALTRDSGGRIYAGGSFTNAGGLVANGLAQWVGSFWLPMGGGVSGGEVLALGWDYLNRLLAGGSFGFAGGQPAGGLSVFDRYWKACGANNSHGAKINAILVDTNNGVVYVGGEFSQIGGVPANSIAVWNGAWSALGSGIQWYDGSSSTCGVVNALAFDSQGMLCVGGWFNRAGGYTTHALAHYYRGRWVAAAGGGLNRCSGGWPTVYSLQWYPAGGYFCVGGDFNAAWGGYCMLRNVCHYYVSAAGPESFQGIALSRGSVEYGVDGPIRAAAVCPANGWMYVGGDANMWSWNGGASSHLLAIEPGYDRYATRYNYLPTVGATIQDNVYTIHFDSQNRLIFTTQNGVGIADATWRGGAEWNDPSYEAWAPLGGGVTNAARDQTVKAFAYDGDGRLFVGGTFTYAGGKPASKLAFWDGASWSALSNNTLDKDVRAIGFDPQGRLLVGGDFDWGWDAASSSDSEYISDGIVMTVSVGPKLEVVGSNGTPVVSGARVSVETGTDFEDVMPIGSSRTHSFRLMNLGTAQLVISNAALSGAAAANFSLSGVPSAVELNSLSNFTVTFTPPSAPGIYEAALTIRSTAGAAYVINLRGSAGCRYIDTSQNTTLGTITPDGHVPVFAGSNQTFTMFSTNNRLPYATVDGVYRDILYSNTYTNVTANGHHLHVDFNIDTIVSGIIVTQRSTMSRDKYIDINYTLSDGDNSSNTISVAISTNGGDTFDVVLVTCSGDIGPGVTPGTKHILWVAHQDWDGEYCPDSIIRVTASDDNGDGVGDSAPTVLDTLYGVRPRVLQIRGFDRNGLTEYGDFFNEGTAATFLNDIGSMYGVSEFNVPMRAVVDWRGTVEGNVEWYVNGRLARTGSASAEQTFSVSSDFGQGGKLEAQAVPGSSGYRRSAMLPANFKVVSAPKLWTRFTATAPYGGNKIYQFLSPNVSYSRKSDEKIPSKTSTGKDMPGAGKNSYESPLSFKMSGQVDLQGAGNLSAEMSRNWEVQGIGITPSVSGGVEFEYAYEDSSWVYGGYFALGADVSMETPPRYITLSPPLYGKIGAHVGVMGTIHFNEHFDPEFGETEFTVTPGLWVTMGCGVDGLANVEGLVGLDLPNTFQISPFEYDLDLSLRAELSANLLCFSFSIWSESWDFDIFPRSHGGGGGQLSLAVAEMKPSDFVPMRRDYLYTKGGAARGLENKLLARDGTEVIPPGGGGGGPQPSPGEVFVQADGFPFSEPALDVQGTNRMLLWVADAGLARDPNNRSIVRCSVWNGSAWADRGGVWDDGTADSSPQMGLLPNGQAIAAWQNSAYVLSSTSTLVEALTALEIAVARFDGTNWAACNLTTNGVMDRAPQLSVANNGTALVTWQRNGGQLDTDSLIMTQVDSLYYSFWNGTSWSSPQVLAVNAGVVLGASLAWNGSVGHLFVALDADHDITTDGDQEIYSATYSGGTWSVLTRRTANTVQDTRPQAVFDSSGNLLVAWYQDGKVYSSASPTLSGPSLVGEIEKTSAAQDFRLVTGPQGEIAMIWSDTVEPSFFQNPFIFNYDRAFNLWSKPVPLLTDSALERSYSGKFGTNGNVVLAYNKVEVQVNDVNAVTNIGRVTALATLEHQMGYDAGVFASDFSLSSTNLTPGYYTYVTVKFRNLGELAATNAWGRLYAGDPAAGGTLLGETHLDWSGKWRAGDEGTLMALWHVHWNVSSLYAVVSIGQNDRNLANNTAVFSPKRPDFMVSRLSVQQISKDERRLNLQVRNQGYLFSPSNRVVLRMNSTNGPELASFPIGPIDAGYWWTNSYTWNMSGLVFTEAFVRVFAIVDPSNQVQEVVEANNVLSRRLVTNLDSDRDGLLDGDEVRHGTDPLKPDTDGDGLNDYDELFTYGGDPRDPDSDQDGLADGAEVQRSTELRNPDSDGDGFSDGVEVAKGSNPLDPNSYPSGMLALVVRGEPAPFGVARPNGYGTNHYDSGAMATSRVDGFVSVANGIRQACTGWTGSGSAPASGSGTQVVFSISNASTVTWNFVRQYELSLDTLSDDAVSDAPGAIAGSSTGWYNEGSTIIVTGAPLPEYLFAGWSGDVPTAMTNQNPLTLQMTNSRSLYARFVRRTYTLQVNSSRGTPTPGVGLASYLSGTILSPRANSPVILNGIMYECTGWTMSGNEPEEGTVSTATSFGMVLTNNATLTWYWQTNALLTTSAGVGGIISGSDAGWYPFGAGITLTATPDANYRFTGWSGDVPPASVTNNPLSLAMSQGRAIAAVFANPFVTITVVANPPSGGSVSGGGSYRAGSNVVLTATPITNWMLTAWNDGNTNRVRTIVVGMTSVTYTATFAPIMSTVTVQANPPDGGTVTGSGTYQAGANIGLSATAFPNWNFAGWNDGNTNSVRTIVVPQTNITYTAAFPRVSPAYWYVTTNGSDAAAGTNWITAKRTIQAAADLARDGDVVTVSNGTYASGGRPAGGGALTNRVAITNAFTVRSLNGPDQTVIRGESGVRGVYLAAGSVLSGFTITNGATLTSGAVGDQNGGGVWAAGSAVISNCVVVANTANLAGGGVFGGRLANCALYTNSAAQGGGAFGAALVNCTLAGNMAGEGGGAHSSTGRNSIVYLNTAATGSNAQNCSFNYSCVAPLPAGAGNTAGNPVFFRASRGNFRLGVTSPCLNAGDNAAAAGSKDLQGADRIQSGTVDMGAYEGGLTLGGPEACYAGAATVFDGVDDYLMASHADSLNLNGDFTIEAWVRLPDLLATRQIITKQPTYGGNNYPGNYELRIEGGTGRLTFGFEYGSVAPGATAFWTSLGSVPTGQYAHVAVVFRAGASVQFFINGMLDTGFQTPYRPAMNTQPVRIGARADGYYFKGQMDEVRLWNVARGASDLAAWYRSRMAGNEPGLAAYWRMDDGFGGTVADSSGNGNTATLLNGATFARSTARVDRVSATSTNAVVISLSGFENSFPANYLTAKIFSLPALGSLRQYGTLDPISSVPAVVTDPSRRVVYLPPADTADTDSFVYQVNDGDFDSLNTVTVLVNVATVTYIPYASYPGAALRFNGSNMYASVPHSAWFNLSGAMTLEAWVKINNLTQYHPIIAKQSGSQPGNFELRIEQGTGRLVFGFRTVCASANHFCSSESSVPTGRWTHVAVAYNNVTGLRLYINGQPDFAETTSDPGCFAAQVNASPVLIGARADGLRFGGEMDGVRVWNRTLSDAEIANLRDGRPFGNENGLVGYWPMDDGTGALIADASGHGNDGALYTNVPFVLSSAPVDLVFVAATNDVSIALSGFKSNSAPDSLTATILSLPDAGTLKQYGTLTPITSVPTQVSDSQRRLVYTPPLANAIYPFSYSVSDGVNNSPNVAVVRIQVATIPGDRYVNSSNPSPVAPYVTWDTAATNIQQAVDVATDGDTIHVAPGVYAAEPGRKMPGYQLANRVYVSKPVTVRGEAGPEVTIIRATGTMRGVFLGNNARLEGFTVTGGHTLFATGGTPGADMRGGGVYGDNTTVVTNCILSGNWAVIGGGVGCVTSMTSSGASLYNCRLLSNSASEGGGAFNSTLHGCYLGQNISEGGHGPVFYTAGGGASHCTLDNCVLVGNSSTWYGGGVWGGTLYNCTLVGNSANPSYAGGAEEATLINCISYFNSGLNHENCAVYYSCTTPNPGGTGNVTSDPMFKSVATGDFSLLDGSPCVNAGDTAYATNFLADFAGNPRVQGEIVDMGARESPAVKVSVVAGPPQAGTTTGSGNYSPGTTVLIGATPIQPWVFTGWSHGPTAPKTTVTVPAYSVTYTGLFMRPPNVIWYVSTNGNDSAAGTNWATAKQTIQVAINAASTGDTVLVSNGVYAAGGMAAGGNWGTRVVLTIPIPVRSVNGAAVTIIKGDSGTRGAYVCNGAVLDGFTVRDGYTDFYWDSWGDRRQGGGVFCEPSGVVANCIIRNNFAMENGGGVYRGIIRNCYITAIESGAEGGAVYNATVENSLLCGVRMWAVVGGVARNCTIVNNGIGATYADVRNCIIASSTYTNWEVCAVSYTCTSPNSGGTGNITNNPQFVNAGAGNFQLLPTSPCRNVGNNADVTSTNDMLGMPRIVEGIVDMGAYEVQTQIVISVVANPPQGGSVTGGGIYPVGSNVELTATAEPNWTFDRWSDGETSAVRTVVTGGTNATYTANFITEVHIAGAAVPDGTGTFEGEGDYLSGSIVQLRAVPTAPWIFVKWSTGSTNALLTLIAPASDAVYQASFALVTPPSGTTAGGNAVTVSNGHFGIITNVLLGGVPVSIQDSGLNWVRFVVPAPATVGTWDVRIQTFDNGDTVIPRAYTVNSPGRIHGPVMARPTHGNLAAGGGHTIALRSDGSASAWGGYVYGYNYGQLNVPPPNENFVGVGAAWYHSVYLRSNGTISAVGKNDSGECNVPAPNEGYVAVDCSFAHSVALRTNGTVVAWGENGSGQCNVPSPNSDFIAVAAGDVHSLGLKADGSVVAWGDNSGGQLNVPAPNSNFVAVAGGINFSVGLKSNGTVVAWGALGLPSPNTNFVAISAGRAFAAALRADGSVVCWGDNSYGQCNVPGPNEGFVEVSCGTYHAAGLKADGTIVTWGRNNWNQMNSVASPNQDYGIHAPGVQPSIGVAAGGYPVVISGTNLCDGTDVTNVILAGVQVSEIVSQSATQIVVIAGAASGPATGDVRVCSTAFGVTVRSNGFIYVYQNIQTITFPPIADQIATNRLVLGATASSGLAVSYSVVSGPAVISGGANLSFTGVGLVQVTASQPGNAQWMPAADVDCTFVVYPAEVTIQLNDLAQTYDGTPRVVSCATTPTGLPALVLYDGLTNVPVAVGTYEVSATIDDPRYEGSAAGTLVVGKADADVYLLDLTHYYNGSVRSAAATTLPAGLMVDFAYEGNVQPIEAGSYGVTGTVSSLNYEGSAAGILTIIKSPQSIAFDGIATQLTTYITPLSATAGSGLPVGLTVLSGPGILGSPISPSTLTYSGPGEVVVRASQAGDAQWEPAEDVTRTIVVVKATATLVLGSLSQVYNGTTRPVTVATVPAGVAVAVTYDGGSTPPTDPGIYSVTATVNDVTYQNEVVAQLTISKGAGTVYLSDLVHIYDGTPKSATATTMPAGLSIDITYDGNQAAPTNSGSYFVVAELNSAYYSGYGTGTLQITASGQTISFPAISNQVVTNVTMLSAAASSGLPVNYDIGFGPAYQVDSNALAYSDRGWIEVVARQPGEGNWGPAPEVTNRFRALGIFTVNVESVYGVVAPAPGLYPFVEESVVTSRYVSGSPINQDATQYVVAGWTMIGHEPASGSGMQMVMTVTNDAMLVWNWLTNFWLSAAAGPHGAVSPTGAWVRAGVTTSITAVPDAYYAFDHWSGDVSGQTNPILVVMSQPLSVQADFRIVYMLLTVLPQPSTAGSASPTGTTAVLPATPVGIAAQPIGPRHFARWFQIGGGSVADSAAPTTTVTLVSNSVVTAYFLQNVSTNVSARAVAWRTNLVTGTLLVDIQICNTNTQGYRLTSPFWYCVASNAQCHLRQPTGREPTTGYPYVDVTTQVLAQVTDGILQPGQCVNVTNVEFHGGSRLGAVITNMIWALWAVRLPSVNEMDTDGDGIPDEWEQRFPSAASWLNPLDWNSDFDRDTFSSKEEWIAGTDPDNGSSYILITGVRRGGGVRHVVQWPSVAGRVYDIAGATNLAGNFTVLGTGLPATPPLNVYTDTVYGVGKPVTIYRIDARLP